MLLTVLNVPLMLVPMRGDHAAIADNDEPDHESVFDSGRTILAGKKASDSGDQFGLCCSPWNGS